MNGLGTEAQLRAALVEISLDTPPVAEVVPAALTESQRPRRLPRWTAPAVAAVVVVLTAVALVWTQERSSTAPATSSDPQKLFGVLWVVRSVNGQTPTEHLAMRVEPNGRFYQNLGGCSGLIGSLTVTGPTLTVTHVEESIGMCPVTTGTSHAGTDAGVTAGLRDNFTASLTWTVNNGSLILSKPSGASIGYDVSPGTPAEVRNWTYHGVGITVPASWPKNATACGTPMMNTVIYPGPIPSCLSGPDHPVTSVRFSTYRSGPDPYDPLPGPPSRIVIDNVTATMRRGVPQSGTDHGLHIIEVQIPSRGVTITIASPSANLAASLSDGIYLT